MTTDEGWMPPTGAPAIPPPPYRCEPESKYMYVFYDRPDDVLERAVPGPLELAQGDGPRVRIAIGDPIQPPHTHGRYHEGIVSVKVTFDGQVGWYLPYIWTNNDEAMDTGRLYGWYKQYCDDTPIQIDGNRIRGDLERDGDSIISVKFRSTSAPGDEDALAERLGKLFEGTVYGVKKVPSPEEGGKVLKQVVTTNLENVVMHEIWGGDATVELTPTPKYPFLHEFQPDQRDIVAAFYARPEFILPHGEVVWDRYE